MEKLKVIHENNDFVIIDKPSGLIVHKGAGETGDTLADLILKKYPKMKKEKWIEPKRAGIVHRLDKDTSGLMIIAKNLKTLNNLQNQFKSHLVEKKYQVLVYGKMENPNGKIISQISRDPNNRLKQKATYLNLSPALGKNSKSRMAATDYKTIREFNINNDILSLLNINLHTGRMHQIRVHMLFKGHSVIGDQTYNTKNSKNISDELAIKRQFLHAYKLKFNFNNNQFEFNSKLPNDLQDILKTLEN